MPRQLIEGRATPPTPIPSGVSQLFINTFNILTQPVYPNTQYLTPVIGSVSIQLAGFGSQVPRFMGIGFLAKGTELATNEGEGLFSTFVVGNDYIDPAGTYYAVTFNDENGDAIQTAAYIILGNRQLQLDEVDPYDPNQPPPALPPLITNLLLVLPWAPDMQFPGDQYLSFRSTLTGNVTSSELIDQQPGNLYTFIIQQDAVGGHMMTWPTNSYNMPLINLAPNGITIQTCVMDETSLWPIGPATWYMP